MWLDPLRGGAWWVKESLTLESVRWEFVPKVDYSLLVGVIAQLYTRREEGVLLAPLGWVLGATAALMPGEVALVSAIVSITGLFAFRNFFTFFMGGGLAVVFLGWVLGANVLWLGPTIGLYFVPLIAPFVTGKTLELPTRDASGPTK
ncbi:MAG: hypothetical protein J6386_11165 [Candidatus Synoicihabitans palmerolidicus]|nr:hypothetical protein [Candidatus Synoicihabitans palmerolidicus]